MATSDSEEFESADESVDVKSAGGKKGQKGASKNESKKTSSKKPSAVEISDSAAGDSSASKPSDSVPKSASSIDEEKVFDMFDDKTSQRPLASKESEKNVTSKTPTREPKPSNIGKKLGSKLGTSISAKEKSSDVKSKVVDSRKKVDEQQGKTDEKVCVKQSEPTVKKEESKPEVKSNPDDGWELEDGFEVPVSNASKPKNQQEFEKELFPVLNKLSSLTTNTKNEAVAEEKPPTASADSGGSGWSGWGGWGVSSILSTATEGVTTLTSHVSAGLNTVLESGLGAPDPQVLAEVLEREKAEKEKEGETKEKKVSTTSHNRQTEASEQSGSGGFGGIGQLMSGVSQLGTKVLSGGLDTLETLGKKTMEVLQDGDPGLRKKRALFFQDDDKPVLSQILREAKETAEKSDKMEEEKQAAKRVHLESLFDDYQGLVHLEALEMLSNQCQLKLQSILLNVTGDELKDLQETLEQVKELCELPDEEEDDDKDDDVDFKDKLTEAVGQLCKDVPHSKDIRGKVSLRIDAWLKSEEAKAASRLAVHEKAVASMAEFTSVSMEIFHRAAELLLIKTAHSTATEAECLTQITTILCIHVSRMATKFTMLLTENSESKENNKIITTIFMESAQCSSYIQDACRLVVPVLQVGAAN
ncbi:protein FAM114A2 [Nilaparvata lugens]|uniref:protein FAM114A2 n=1 Tax=Nilaparvata lugens TaxID=108931 RepID=UPI00193E6EDB|nr:protein FAM114A2 [Nilaparvata lugens]